MAVAIPILPAPPPGGGGVPPGAPNAIAYYDPFGVTITTDALLTAFPLDPFGRPQVWDKRVGGAGAVYRQGQWAADGDPGNTTGDGLVIYGPSVNGIQTAAEGAIGRSKHNRFALFTIIPGGPGGGYNQWRVDPTEMVFRKDDATATRTFEVARSTGDAKTLGDVTPYADASGNVGTDALRFARVRAVAIVAGDLELRDEERGAHWVLREERDRIVVVNKSTGKRYAMALTPLGEEEE